MSKKLLTIYSIAVLVLSFLLQGLVLLMDQGDGEKPTWAILIMYAPALVTFIFLFWVERNRNAISWKIGRWPYLFVGALLPALLTMFVSVLLGQLGLGKITHFHFEEGRAIVEKGAFLFGKGSQSLPFFMLNCFATALIFPFIGSFAAFGEELAWRGYLQAKLIRSFGSLKGIVILGLLWGFWHLPFNLNGYNYPETPVLGALLFFPLTTIFVSFFLAWLTLKAKSFWPAVVAHSSHNAFFGAIIGGMDFGEQRFQADIIILCIWALIAVCSYLAIKRMDLHPSNP